MRPVERGKPPKAYADYNLALEDLYNRIGRGCSYCERKYSGAVEHILPKARHPGLVTTWTNFLVACTNCNSIKNRQQNAGTAADPAAARNLYLWPDTDNTARAFEYSRGAITVSGTIPPGLAKAAQDTMEMTGFHRLPRTGNPPKSRKDLRWKERNEAWDLAERKARQLAASPSPELRETIAELAAATGFWSVWRKVFATDADMLGRLNQAFTGTESTSFDANSQPVARKDGRL